MSRSNHVPIIVAITLAVLIVGVGNGGIRFLANAFKYDSYEKQDFIDNDLYQAIFLTNDQIYFGKLKNANSEFLILYDVYYVKVGEGGAGQLVKLGAIEPHAPQDRMVISKSQVLFWENLRADSTIVKTIQNIEKK